ncbi:MAG: hypothetical protein IT580_21935, partial [Verrucomicrobiales bacterium]|nr:hypothetical protein [Verrucomicrobiales bacterium]
MSHPLRVQILLCLLSLALPATAADPEWFDFQPAPDPLQESALDLRRLNERFAGEKGRIIARGEEFVHATTGQSVRLWAVNGPSTTLTGDALRQCARRLAKYGVNLSRLHGALFDRNGKLDAAKVPRMQETVAALKAEGIHTLFSIYFPLWMTPSADHPWLKGYDGKQHPFVALMFNPEFQEQYRGWWKALLLTPDAQGRRLVDEPALFALEIQNEDSFFFWTFNPDQIPGAQRQLLETQFGVWLKQKYGSLENALSQWKGSTSKGDDPASGRVGFRPLWNMAHEKTARDRDTVRFLFETQRNFYVETQRFLREIGF